MTTYSNLLCDPLNPRTQIDLAAAGILAALTARGGQVNVSTVDNAIINAGGDLRNKMRALRALRNLGYGIVVNQAADWTTYMLDATPDEHDTQNRRAAQAFYSRLVGLGRGLAGDIQRQANPDPMMVQHHGMLEGMAIDVGRRMGVSAQQVLDEMQPLTV
jgi:hypothetical protein